MGGWERLDWVTDACIKAECIAAESRAKDLIADSDDSVLWFSDYGADWIKSVGTVILQHFLLRRYLEANWRM